MRYISLLDVLEYKFFSGALDIIFSAWYSTACRQFTEQMRHLEFIHTTLYSTFLYKIYY